SGGGSGIGRASSILLAQAGSRGVVTDIDQAAAEQTAEQIVSSGGEAISCRHDVTVESEWQQVIDRTLEAFGQLNVLVNNAGISGTSHETFETTSFDQWRTVMSINLDGVFLGCQKAVQVMKEGSGSIINISSVMGMVGGAGAAYNASKGGVRLLTKSVAAYCGNNGYNIRVNSVHPGYVWTPLVDDIVGYLEDMTEDQLRAWLTTLHPIGRLGTPDDIARGVLFLASDDSSFMTGSELVIDGGYTAV
ncbi:MAG: SDR family oxidoreductase, partial [Pseudomonadales bacterium]|nr:SDR family oxidoreductase [Pseudomonadales bacterium]